MLRSFHNTGEGRRLAANTFGELSGPLGHSLADTIKGPCEVT